MNTPYRTQRPRRDYYIPEEPKKKFPIWTIPVIVVCVALLIWMWAYANNQLAYYDTFNQMRAVVSQNVIHGPVYIDDTPVTGMTLEEAGALLDNRKTEQARAFSVTLAAEGNQWTISSEDVPMEWDTDVLLQKAYMIGRVGSLEQRYEMIQSLSEPVYLSSAFTYDKSAIRTLTDQIAAHLHVEPVNAAVVAFDVTNRTFAFSEDQAGQTVNAENLYQTVIYQLDNGQYGSTIRIDVQEVPPTITRAMLEKDYTRISAFATTTTDNSNRNTNIALAASAINGQMIAAGGTLSFNGVVGERTAAGGYMEAGAIENGRTVQEIGGGICQVSTTLFNAMVRANCEIVERKPHAWPSDYVPRGEDAAVDWPKLDLKMRNATATPMFITAWYDNQTITVEVYGLSLGEGVSIDIESETTYSKQPTETVYTYNGNLPIGTTQLLKKPRTGYSVQTYKIWKQDGVEMSREKFYTTDYKVINEEYEYNDGNPPPAEG